MWEVCMGGVNNDLTLVGGGVETRRRDAHPGMLKTFLRTTAG